MRRRLAQSLLVATSLACSGRTLTAEGAANLIRDLDHFKREAHFTLETRVPFQTTFKCVEQAEVERAPLIRFGLERGWVRFDSRDTVLGFGTNANCPSLALTQPGEAASAHWAKQRPGASDGVAWAIPIGRRELMEVTKLATAPDGSTQVDFDWKWMPNEIGMELRESVASANAFFDTTRTGRASCRRTTDQWNCELGMWATSADVLGEFRP